MEQASPRIPRMIQLVAYCRRVFEEQGHTPSYSMIREELGIEHDGTVRRYVKQAEQTGLLWLDEYRGGRGPRKGQRIRLGRPDEASTVKIKMGRDL
jgi:hypothetical protein